MRAAVERRTPPKLMVAVANPVLRWLLSRPSPPDRLSEHLALLHLAGRRSGKSYTVPVGLHRDPADGTLFVLTSSGWRHNFSGGAPIELTRGGERHAGTATLVEDPDRVAETYGRLIDEVGLDQAQRQLGVVINVDRTPTHDELVEAVKTSGLSRVDLELD